ncbi:hypothetical protein D3C85_1271540 [compost metagenome]
MAELVHAGKAAQDHPVTDVHVAGQRRVVGEDGVVADLAVVRQMDIGHDPVVVADAGHAAILRGADVEGAEFADGVVVADFQPCRLARVLLVLRHRTQRTELENAVVLANAGMAFDHHVRADPGAAVDADIGADDAVCADFDVGGDLRPVSDDGSRMNGHAYTSRFAHMICASHATWPSTRARALYLAMPRFIDSCSTSSTSWSPGTT